MSWHATVWVRELDPEKYKASVSPSDRVVLFTIATYWNPDHGYAWPSVSTLAEQCFVDRRTIQRALRRLCQAGVLEVESVKSAHGGNGSNRYRLVGLTAADFEAGRDARRREGRGGTVPPPGGQQGAARSVNRKEDSTFTAASVAAMAADRCSSLDKLAPGLTAAVHRIREVLDDDLSRAYTAEEAAARYAHAYDVKAPDGAAKIAHLDGASLEFIREIIVQHAGSKLLVAPATTGARRALPRNQERRLQVLVAQYGSDVFQYMPRAALHSSKDVIAYLGACCARELDRAALRPG